MKKIFMAVIALMMTISASAQFYIYFSDGQIAQVDSISVRPIAYTITLNHSEIDLKVGEVRSLRAAVSPVVNNTTHAINWTSSNPEVVRVNSLGEVTALAAGTATITATMDAEEVTPATCVVNVTNIAYTITLNHSEIELGVSETRKLSATVTPTSKEPIQWSSNNPEVATVNASGIVEAVNFGTAVITATIDASDVTPATCVVNVTNDAVLNTFELGGYALFDLGTPIAGTDTVLKISAGEVTCQLAPSLYYVWDKGIVLVNNSLSGAGYLLPIETYTYVITDSPNGAYNGYYVSGFDIVVDTIDDALAFSSQNGVYAAPYGQLLDVDMYGRAWDGIVAAGNQEDIEAANDLYYASQTGTQFYHIDFNTGSQSYNYGNLSYLYLTEDRETGELYYDLKLEWYDHVNEGRWYGLLAETEFEENESPTGFVKPYDMRVIHKQYQVLPPVESNQAPAMMPKKSILVPKKMIEWDIEKLSNLPRKK